MAEIILPNRVGCSIERGPRYFNYSIFRCEDYRSPGKSIVANVEVAECETIYSSDGQEFNVPAGGKYIGIHFDPPNGFVYVSKRGYHKVVENLKIGYVDYINFLETLQQEKKFKGIQIVAGSTTLHLVRLAVNKLGFHYDNFEDSPAANHDDPDNYVLFYGVADELITKLPFLYSYQGKLLE